MRKKIKDAAGGVKRNDMEEQNKRQQWIEDISKYPDFAKILQHFGYDPFVYGMMQSTPIWCKERLFKEVPYVKGLSEIFPGRRLRIVIDYDPEYPRTLLRIEQIPTPEEANNEIKPVSKEELEFTEKL